MNGARPSAAFLERHATSTAIASLTVLMLLAALVFWRQAQANEAAKGWVVHTYEVLGHIRVLSSRLGDAELAQRGYAMTGDEDYLEPYEDALRDGPEAVGADLSIEVHRSIAQELAAIRKLTTDNPRQWSDLDEMDAIVKKTLDYWAITIQAERNHDAKAVAGKIDFHRGKELMDRIRGLARIMETEENQLLQVRTAVEDVSVGQSQAMTFAGIGLFYVAMSLSIFFYQRNRARAQAEQMHYTRELEKREEELKVQQEELKASNEEIEASNEELKEKTHALEAQNAQIQVQSEELTESQRVIATKARELERASQYKSEFLANMSHELRTPLNSLLILAKLLAENDEGNLTEAQIEEARVIYNGALELLGLINDILDLSKVEAGKLVFTAEDVALGGIVKRMEQHFAPVAKAKGVAFAIDVAADLPARLNTDAQRVEQILKNLLSNAFKFTEQGSVKLQVRRPQKAELQRASSAGNGIAFSVVDTGIGIEPSKFKEIFEAFQQEDGSTDRHYGGTGLGLTIARKFADRLGGQIHVASQKGEGSRFTLVLPVARAHDETEEAGAATPEAAWDDAHNEPRPAPKPFEAEFIPDDRYNIGDRDKLLLIIEDDPTFAGILMQIARKRGYKCLAAGNGKSGLVLASERPVTAVILDLELPDIEGLNVLDQLKHDLRTRHIPVHIISGRDEGEVAPLRKGAIGYLAKPADRQAIDGVITKIEEMLRSEVKRVLIVEDDSNTQVAVQTLLKKKDISIAVAGTGDAALKQISDAKFDCVILDLRLPDMSGFEWLQRLEKIMGDDAPPVVVYTGKELTEEENRQLARYTGSVVIKGAKSMERLLDEVTLFLHSVELTLPEDLREIIRMQHDPDSALIGRNLLLVDDDLRNTFALSKLLRTHGMNIVLADNGQMALDKLRQDPSIELVIMDIMMPVMDGYQAMREIRARDSLRGLPIIALTARAMPEEQAKCMAAGANDYLTKPVNVELLLTLLRVSLFKQELAA